MDLSKDYILGKAIWLWQRKDGYRAGLDAALLAARFKIDPGQTVLDVGCGVGAVALSIAKRNNGAQVTGLERDEETHTLFQRNITENEFTDCVSPICADVSDGFANIGLDRFDFVVSNPPYFDDAGAMRLENTAKAGAYICDPGLQAWIKFMMDATKSGGHIAIIHRADALGDILAGFGRTMGEVVILPVYSYGGQYAKRVLVTAKKHRKGALSIRPSFTVHQKDGKYTPEVEAILHGHSGLTDVWR